MTSQDTYRIKIFDGSIYNMFPEPVSAQAHIGWVPRVFGNVFSNSLAISGSLRSDFISAITFWDFL